VAVLTVQIHIYCQQCCAYQLTFDNRPSITVFLRHETKLNTVNRFQQVKELKFKSHVTLLCCLGSDSRPKLSGPLDQQHEFENRISRQLSQSQQQQFQACCLRDSTEVMPSSQATATVEFTSLSLVSTTEHMNSQFKQFDCISVTYKNKTKKRL